MLSSKYMEIAYNNSNSSCGVKTIWPHPLRESHTYLLKPHPLQGWKMSVSPMTASRSRSSALTPPAGVIVLDIGSIYTKYVEVYSNRARRSVATDSWYLSTLPLTTRIGLASEAAPRHIIRSRVTMRPYGNVGGRLLRRILVSSKTKNEMKALLSRSCYRPLGVGRMGSEVRW